MLTPNNPHHFSAEDSLKIKLPIEPFKNIPRVLLVEDDPINQKASQLLLDEMGCVVDLAETGQQAVFFFERGYDIVLMDIGLPDFDGLEATKKIRNLYPEDKTPVIACTAQSSQSMKNECLSVGMNDVFTKPASMSKLYTIINQALTPVFR